MIAWLETEAGKMLAALLIVGVVAVVCWASGHRSGYASAIRHTQTVVDACLRANGTQSATIDQLREANAAFADQAAAQQAAQAQVVAQARANAEALTEAQRRLQQALARPDAARWAGEPVPQDVVIQLRD